MNNMNNKTDSNVERTPKEVAAVCCLKCFREAEHVWMSGPGSAACWRCGDCGEVLVQDGHELVTY
jgi:hypothetical protein